MQGKVSLHWTPTGWNTPELFRGVPHCISFDSIEELKSAMSKCIYNGEYVTDEKGQRVDIDWESVCAKAR